MIIQLQPEQVSEHWFSIKYAACASMETEDAQFVQALLTALLSETHQCWLIFDDERELVAMGLTCIVEESLTHRRCLHVEAFYSYHTMTDVLTLEAGEYIKQFARASNCKQVRTLTYNPRAMRLLELIGFRIGKTEYLLDAL